MKALNATLTMTLTTLGLALLSACGTATQDGTSALKDETHDAAEVLGDVEPGSFRLYTTPFFEPNPSCDIYTRLQLINGFAGPVAAVSNHVSGMCEIAIVEAVRTYELVEQEGSCGSRRYVGTDGNGAQLEIIDHRNRVCRDKVDAEVIVKETIKDRTKTLYSTYHIGPEAE